VESHGVRAVPRLERARRAGPAIVADVASRDAELIVIGAQRRGRGRAQVLGATARHVLKHSPCRAIVVAGREAA
jgi:nucleotide-binding universal stress UspA family protein